METKYYSPSMDEFCIGFEYEYSLMGQRFVKMDFENNTIVNLTEPVKHWTKGIVEDIDTLKMLDVNFIDTDRIRVKYLDREDLESFGFIYYSERQHGLKLHENCSILFKMSNIHCHFSTDLGRPNITILVYGQPYFVGRIKNKTELAKLLKQLNII